MRYLTVDGMLSGTGIRDSVEGGYIEPSALGISEELKLRLSAWLARYADSHYTEFEDRKTVAELDSEGLEICRKLREELPHSKVVYFSDADMKALDI